MCKTGEKIVAALQQNGKEVSLPECGKGEGKCKGACRAMLKMFEQNVQPTTLAPPPVQPDAARL